MVKVVSVDNGILPVESHIIAEGKEPSTRVAFKLQDKNNISNLRPIELIWKNTGDNDNFIKIFA